jgi:hypothetical protein
MSKYGSIYEISWWGYIGKAFGWGQVYPFNSDQIPFTADTISITADVTQYTADQTVF